MDTFIDSTGHKRKGIVKICAHPNCEKSFMTRKGTQRVREQMCCSTSCSYDLKKFNRVEVVCAECGSIILKPLSRTKIGKSGFNFCSRKCKDKSQSLVGKCSAIRPSHYGNGNSYDNSFCKQHLGDVCMDCQESRSYLLVIHHIDSNRSNNNLSNLERLCWNCHAIRHLKKLNEDWVYDPNSLTPREQIKYLNVGAII